MVSKNSQIILLSVKLQALDIGFKSISMYTFIFQIQVHILPTLCVINSEI